MNNQNPGSPPTINVKNLCSRKLWELLHCSSKDKHQQHSLIEELQLRQHYLTELKDWRPQLH
ncbi:MAG: hypothetical protein ACJAYG_000696 [Oceanicoccus sp.]|jgi:hypothetical protein